MLLSIRLNLSDTSSLSLPLSTSLSLSVYILCNKRAYYSETSVAEKNTLLIWAVNQLVFAVSLSLSPFFLFFSFSFVHNFCLLFTHSNTSFKLLRLIHSNWCLTRLVILCEQISFKTYLMFLKWLVALAFRIDQMKFCISIFFFHFLSTNSTFSKRINWNNFWTCAHNSIIRPLIWNKIRDFFFPSIFASCTSGILRKGGMWRKSI